jgi:hypothetical protein
MRVQPRIDVWPFHYLWESHTCQLNSWQHRTRTFLVTSREQLYIEGQSSHRGKISYHMCVIDDVDTTEFRYLNMSTAAILPVRNQLSPYPSGTLLTVPRPTAIWADDIRPSRFRCARSGSCPDVGQIIDPGHFFDDCHAIRMNWLRIGYDRLWLRFCHG